MAIIWIYYSPIVIAGPWATLQGLHGGDECKVNEKLSYKGNMCSSVDIEENKSVKQRKSNGLGITKNKVVLNLSPSHSTAWANHIAWVHPNILIHNVGSLLPISNSTWTLNHATMLFGFVFILVPGMKPWGV